MPSAHRRQRALSEGRVEGLVHVGQRLHSRHIHQQAAVPAEDLLQAQGRTHGQVRVEHKNVHIAGSLFYVFVHVEIGMLFFYSCLFCYFYLLYIIIMHIYFLLQH